MPRRILLSCVLMLSATSLCSSAQGEEFVPDWLTQSRALAQQLSTDLKGELGSALGSSGATGAIEVCRTRAPQIAAQLSRQSGATVSRTALRVRNPANAPDDMQRAVLEQFADDLASGRVETPLEAALEIDRDGKIERRYMRAIATDALCLTCHGPALAPDVAAVIAREYPNDQATGFEPGQLRGAVSVIWPAVPRDTKP